MQDTCLILCDRIDNEVESISNLLEHVVVLDTTLLTDIFIHNGIYPGSQQHEYESGFEFVKPVPSSVRSIYWRSLNSVPFLSSIQGPRNGLASINLILHQYRSAKYFNSPNAFWYHINKPLQLEAVKKVGILIPPTLYTSSHSLIKSFVDNVSQAVVKPISGGDYARLADRSTIDNVLNSFSHDATQECVPLTIQKYMKGANIRSYVIGGNVYSAKVISDLPDYRIDADCRIIPVDTSFILERLCLKVQKCLGLEWTAIDWIQLGGEYVFLEANFSPMFHGFQIATGYPISSLLAAQLSA